jgi:DNA-binding beta-propeller fold protein YncE
MRLRAHGRETRRRRHTSSTRETLMRRLPFLTLVLALLLAAPAAAAPASKVIVLPGATSAEGIAVGRGATFYAGDLFTGDLYTGNLQSGDASLLRAVPAGRMAVGMDVDERSNRVFVAGGFTGQGYVYDGATGRDVAVYDLVVPPAGTPGTPGTLVNDVVVTRQAAWFTDSYRPQLYRVALGPGGSLGAATTLPLRGPAATVGLPTDINLNGIAATPDGKRLVVAHATTGRLYGVDPGTGSTWEIAGVDVPSVDGILLEGGRLYAVQNFLNKISVIRLAPDLTSGTVERTITDKAFRIPTTVARHGNRLAVVNAKFDTGIPPKAEQFEVVIVNAR